MIGNPEATEDEMISAAGAAQAHEFILHQPDKYDTAVAEAGMSLSGGQKQRIAISRALLRPAEILIMDDSTSALDLGTEAQLFKALGEGYGNMTKIIIAQRIATVMRADRIAVLDKGRIVGIGSHTELLDSCDVSVLRELLDRSNVDVHTCSARDIVEDYRDIHSVSDSSEVCHETLLSSLVIVRSNMEQSVSAHCLSLL